MTLFEAVLLSANSAFAGAWLTLSRNGYEMALGLFSLASVIMMLFAEFA